MRRVMCVWFPRWPVQRLRAGLQGPEEKPRSIAERLYVLLQERRRGFEVVVYSPEASEWGIRTGMPLGEVRSLLSPLAQKKSQSRATGKSRSLPVLKRLDPVADRSRLQAIALDFQAYSPLVGLEDDPAPESIWLDISGSEDLFGGERKLAETLRTQLSQQRLQARVAIADSWGAAWAVSHFGNHDLSLVPPGQQMEWLKPLPVAALRLSATVQDSLQTLNIVTIDELLQLPRPSLPSRFGKQLVQRLDQAAGLVPELLVAERLEKPLFAEWLFDEPVTDRQSLDHVCEVLLERLLAILDERRAGLRELACHWLGTKAEPTMLRLLRPTTDRRHLQNLLRLQCERRVFTAGIQGVRMEVVEMGLSVIRQASLFGDDLDEKHPQELAELIDRLSLRLGRGAVVRPHLIPDPQPEFCIKAVPWLDRDQSRADPTPAAEGGQSQLRCRPLQLLPIPRQLSIQKVCERGLPTRVNQSSVLRMHGPERIETGWWRGPDVKRDYYCLDLANGSTLWVFLDRNTQQWFLHGLFHVGCFGPNME